MVRARIFVGTVFFMAVSASTVLAFPQGAPAGFDGSPSSGFTSCNLCHSGPVTNGGILILGSPARYIPGNIYDLTVRVFDPVQFGAGFELSVETPNGQHIGQLVLSDPTNTQFASADPNFVTQTLSGHIQSEVDWVSNGNSFDFIMQWIAPASNVGTFSFYAAGNADNDNVQASGDSIYVASAPSEFNTCPPDLNGDGVVNAADLASMLAVWGTNNPNVDTNGDGIVNSADLANLLALWGTCP